MKELLDAFWRAAAYCLHPKVIGLSLLPLLLCALIALGLGWLFWEPAMDAVRATLESWQLVDAALRWVETMVGGSFRTVLAPLIVVMLALPVVVVLSLLLVALLMTPAVVGLIAARRFPALERRRGAGLALSVAGSFGRGGVASVFSAPLASAWVRAPPPVGAIGSGSSITASSCGV